MTIQSVANDQQSRFRALRDGLANCRIYIELRTGSALRLVTGRPSGTNKSAIVGLFGFADRLRLIWDAAKSGDPYAQWWLVKVEASIGEARDLIKAERQSVRQTLAAFGSVGLNLGQSELHSRVGLLFACPYAYHGAQLVKQVDDLITELDISVQIGARRRRETAISRRNTERAMRRTFATAQGFWEFGVTRELIQQQAPNVLDAETKMGVVPDDILSGRRWPVLLEKNHPEALESSAVE